MRENEREFKNYKDQCIRLEKRLQKIIEDQRRTRQEVLRSRMITDLMRNTQHLIGFNLTTDELDRRFLEAVHSTMDLDRAALLKRSRDNGYFLVQAYSGFPEGAYPGFSPPGDPPQFFYANSNSNISAMGKCFRKAVNTLGLLWAYNPRTEMAILIGKDRDSGEDFYPFSEEDKPLAEGALNIHAGITGRKRAEDVLHQTQERLKLALQGADLGMWDWNINTGEVVINTRWANMLGYSVDDIDSNIKTWEKMLHPDDKASALIALRNHLEGLTPAYETEYRLATSQGGWKWILDRGRVVEWDTNNSPVRATGTHLDISERKIAESKLNHTLSQLEKSHDDLLSILNGLNVGTALFDEKGCITFLSSACQKYTGLSTENVLNKSWEKALPFKPSKLDRLKQMIDLPAIERERFSVTRDDSEGRRYFLDVDLMDDPRDPKKKVLCLYDRSEVRNLRQLLEEKEKHKEFIGKTKSIQRVFEQITQLSKVDATVLIEGETGTGKELVARALHFSSPRKDKPFVAVNCSGLTDSVLHSQLFGHKKGAFTGAVSDQRGVFYAAKGGTVFLDEISGVSISVQASLLRVLEEKEITPLGTSSPIKIDIRILVATNQDLREAVAKGEFRQDLLYRIRVARINLPPLHQRRDDIPLLARSFFIKFRAVTGKNVEDISPETMQILMEYNWPGNVRELKNAIEFALIQCNQVHIFPRHLPLEILEPIPAKESVKNPAPTCERDRILAELKKSGGNRSAAARRMGVSRATFYRRLSSLKIDIEKL